MNLGDGGGFNFGAGFGAEDVRPDDPTGPNRKTRDINRFDKKRDASIGRDREDKKKDEKKDGDPSAPKNRSTTNAGGEGGGARKKMSR